MRSALAVSALLLVGLSGCLKTYRVEQHSVTAAGIQSDGTATFANHSDREERQWSGPWVTQPDRARP
jgi:hypothetical protein